MRTERCACGGTITAMEHSPAPAVARHRRTQRHRDYLGIRAHRCAGVRDVPCVVMVPMDRDFCHFCTRTLALMARVTA